MASIHTLTQASCGTTDHKSATVNSSRYVDVPACSADWKAPVHLLLVSWTYPVSFSEGVLASSSEAATGSLPSSGALFSLAFSCRRLVNRELRFSW